MVDASVVRAQQRMRQQAAAAGQKLVEAEKVAPAPTLQKKVVRAETQAPAQVQPQVQVQANPQPQAQTSAPVATAQSTPFTAPEPVATRPVQPAPREQAASAVVTPAPTTGAEPTPTPAETPEPRNQTAKPVSKAVVTTSVRQTYLEAGVSEESLHQSKAVRVGKALSDYAFVTLDKELDWVTQSGYSLEYAPARAKSTVSRARLYELGLMALFNLPLEGSTNAAERAVYGAFLRRVGSSEQAQETERAVEMVREDLSGVEDRVKNVEGMLRFLRKELAEMRVLDEYMVHSTLTSADVVRSATDLTLDTGASFRQSQQILREQTKTNAHELAAHPVSAQTKLYRSSKRGQS